MWTTFIATEKVITSLSQSLQVVDTFCHFQENLIDEITRQAVFVTACLSFYSLFISRRLKRFFYSLTQVRISRKNLIQQKRRDSGKYIRRFPPTYQVWKGHRHLWFSQLLAECALSNEGGFSDSLLTRGRRTNKSELASPEVFLTTEAKRKKHRKFFLFSPNAYWLAQVFWMNVLEFAKLW